MLREGQLPGRARAGVTSVRGRRAGLPGRRGGARVCVELGGAGRALCGSEPGVRGKRKGPLGLRQLVRVFFSA